MQAQAYEGYFENGSFFTAGKAIKIPEKKKVYITILDEAIQESDEKANTLKEIFDSINACDEEIPDTFPRVNFNREFKL